MTSSKKLIILFLNLFFYQSLIGQNQIEKIISEITIQSYQVHFDSMRTNENCTRKVIPAEKQSLDHDACRDYIAKQFKTYLGTENVFLHNFNTPNYSGLCNVIGFKKGRNPHAGIWVVSAHYDTNNNLEYKYSDQSPAPGANDNGTGLAAILEIANVLSTIETEASVLFSAWDLEEQFTNGIATGSNAWFTERVNRNIKTNWDSLPFSIINEADIKGNINFDMFGNPQEQENGEAILWACYAKNIHIEFVNDYVKTFNKYTPKIKAIPHGRLIWSDHYTFALRNIPALVNLESSYSNDPFYHTANDHFENQKNIDWEFACSVTQGGFAFLLEQILHELKPITWTITPHQLQLSENPVAYNLPTTYAKTEIYNAYGKTTSIQTSSFSPTNSGIYFIQQFNDHQRVSGMQYLHKKEGLFRN